jgi:nucleotide-binding universal stress UspA family protein
MWARTGVASVTSCSKTVEKHEPTMEKGALMFSTIVWATNGSELADSTLPRVVELAGIHHSKIVAVHVDELLRRGRFGVGSMFTDEDDVQRKIASQVADLQDAGFNADVEVVSSACHGKASLIADAAADAEADLIVVGTHGRSEAGALPDGSMGNALGHLAHCPILVIPPTHLETAARIREEAVGAGAWFG